MSSEDGDDGGDTTPDTTAEALADAFDRDDPELAPEEKETTLRFARDEDVATFYTAEAGLGRRLIAHPETVLHGVVIKDGRARPTKPPEEVEQGEHVVGVRGTIPLGALSVKSSSRETEQHAAIVSERVLAEVRRE
jgi:hypothetical protein